MELPCNGPVRQIPALLVAASPQQLGLLQVSNPKDIMGAEKLIFPGVGAFEQAMGVLRSKEYTEPLKEFIQVHCHDMLHMAQARSNN